MKRQIPTYGPFTFAADAVLKIQILASISLCFTNHTMRTCELQEVAVWWKGNKRKVVGRRKDIIMMLWKQHTVLWTSLGSVSSTCNYKCTCATSHKDKIKLHLCLITIPLWSLSTNTILFSLYISESHDLQLWGRQSLVYWVGELKPSFCYSEIWALKPTSTRLFTIPRIVFCITTHTLVSIAVGKCSFLSHVIFT